MNKMNKINQKKKNKKKNKKKKNIKNNKNNKFIIILNIGNLFLKIYILEKNIRISLIIFRILKFFILKKIKLIIFYVIVY